MPQIGPAGPEFLIDPSMKAAYETNANPPEWELYDLSKDPYETVNLAGNPEVADAFKNLKQELLDWREETDDPLLDPAELQRLKKLYLSRKTSGKKH